MIGFIARDLRKNHRLVSQSLAKYVRHIQVQLKILLQQAQKMIAGKSPHLTMLDGACGSRIWKSADKGRFSKALSCRKNPLDEFLPTGADNEHFH